jgi:hypothetical protein
MKAVWFLICFPVLQQSIQAQEPIPRLSGIISIGASKLAVLESTRGAGVSEPFVLSERQKKMGVEVLEIDLHGGKVKLDLHERGGPAIVTLTNHSDQATGPSPGIWLENASLDALLSLYGMLSARTLLRFPSLPEATFTFRASATNEVNAAHVLERELEATGISTIADGEKFTMVVPKAEVSKVKPRWSKISSVSPANPKSRQSPTGVVDFPDTDVNQVLTFYADLLRRKLDLTTPSPIGRFRAIKFKTQTPLTRDECIYALDTLLQWARIKMVPSSNNSIKAVPLPEGQ